MKKVNVISLILAAVMMVGLLSGFTVPGTAAAAENSDPATETGADATLDTGGQLDYTEQEWLEPIDVDYTLDCYNLARRYYWMSGRYEEAAALKCPVEKPQRYITLMLDGVGVVASFAIDGKATALGSCLPSESEYYDIITEDDAKLANSPGYYTGIREGVFFFTPDGNCIEWNGKYLYSDIEFSLASDPLLMQKEPDAKG